MKWKSAFFAPFVISLHIHTHTSGLVEQGVLLIFTQGQQQGAALGWATADAKTSTVNANLHYTKNGKILP